MRSAGYFVVSQEFLFDGTLTIVLNKLKEQDYVLDCIERDFRQPNTFKVFGTGPMFEKVGEGWTNPQYDIQLSKPEYDSAHVLVDVDIKVSRV